MTESPPASRSPTRAHAEARYRAEFGAAPELVVRAPGRVNLIGEHTDYNDGFVLPFAIAPAVYVAAGRRTDSRVRAFASAYGELDEFEPATLVPPAGPHAVHWPDYLRGVAWAFREAGLPVPGCNLAIAADLRQRSGLSSSAALELGVAVAFQVLAGFASRRRDLAVVCQRSDNEFVGVKCGIMDQLTVALAEPGAALLIDCRALTTEAVPLPAAVSFAVVDSGADRALAASGYNQRRRECEAAVRAAQQLGRASRALRDLEPADLELIRGAVPPEIYSRACHVVAENRRVLQMVEALRAGDVTSAGRLMYESHASLRDLYEVSTDRLDTIVEVAASIDGVHGARLTGAGFGGSVIVMLARAHATDALRRLAAALNDRLGERLTIEEVAPAGAVGPLAPPLPVPALATTPDGRVVRLYTFGRAETIGDREGNH